MDGSPFFSNIVAVFESFEFENLTRFAVLGSTLRIFTFPHFILAHVGIF